MLRKKHFIFIMTLAFALCLLPLAGCGKDPVPTPSQASGAGSWWEPETLSPVAGEEREPPEEPEGPTDGLEGSYYNDYLRETLILDGRGGCSVSWPGGVMGGLYSLADDGSLAVLLSDLRLTAHIDGSGNLSVDGRQGRYLRDWDFWGITPAEAGIHPVTALPDTEEIALGGGAYRYRDFPAGLALTYDGTLRLAAGRVPGAVCVADGTGGYVVGRNVTLRYDGADAKTFMEDYLRSFVFSDCEALYGPVSGYADMTIFAGGEAAGRLGAGTVTLSCPAGQIAARAILFTSSFDDGTVNYICKCVFAPAGNTAQLDALAAGVYDLGAARIVQLS